MIKVIIVVAALILAGCDAEEPVVDTTPQPTKAITATLVNTATPNPTKTVAAPTWTPVVVVPTEGIEKNPELQNRVKEK